VTSGWSKDAVILSLVVVTQKPVEGVGSKFLALFKSSATQRNPKEHNLDFEKFRLRLLGLGTRGSMASSQGCSESLELGLPFSSLESFSFVKFPVGSSRDFVPFLSQVKAPSRSSFCFVLRLTTDKQRIDLLLVEAREERLLGHDTPYPYPYR
jgi:hypothetical protein